MGLPDPPLFLGHFWIKHQRCWAADITNRFADIRLEAFVRRILKNSVIGWAVFKSRTGLLHEQRQLEILNFLNKLENVDCESVGDFVSDKILWLSIEDQDRPVSSIVRIIKLCNGHIIPEIGHCASKGVDYVNGLFANESDFKAAKQSIIARYSDYIIDEPILEGSAGLCNCEYVPLLLESLAGATIPQHRALINDRLAGKKSPKRQDMRKWLGEVVKTVVRTRGQVLAKVIIEKLLRVDL